MRFVLFLTILMISFSARPNDLAPTGDLLKLYNEGTPPSVKASDLDHFSHDVRFKLKTLLADFSDPGLSVEPGCGRYVSLIRNLTEQISQSLETYTLPPELPLQSDESVLGLTRLRLLIPGFFGLHALFKNQSEAGYGTLDRHIRETCSFINRSEVSQHFDAATNALSTYSREALGNPGLLGFEALTDRLLKIAAAQEKSRNNISWAVFGATLVTSVIIWESVPRLLGLASRRAIARSPTLASRIARTPGVLKKSFVFGARSTGLAAEGLAYSYVDRAIAAPKANTPQELLASWDEQLSELEYLTQSSLWSPQIYLAYIGQVKAQLALLFEPWLMQQLQNQRRAKPAQVSAVRGIE